MKTRQYEKLKNYALKLLSLRSRSKAEIKSKLSIYSAKKKFPPEIINDVITYLEKINLLNDEDFARRWVDQRNQFKQKGKSVLLYELKAKGISSDIASKIVSENFTNIDKEYELAQKAVRKNSKKYRRLSVLEKTAKINQMLLRRGFSFDTIERIIDSLSQKEYNTDDI